MDVRTSVAYYKHRFELEDWGDVDALAAQVGGGGGRGDGLVVAAQVGGAAADAGMWDGVGGRGWGCWWGGAGM